MLMFDATCIIDLHKTLIINNENTELCKEGGIEMNEARVYSDRFPPVGMTGKFGVKPSRHVKPNDFKISKHFGLIRITLRKQTLQGALFKK